MRNDKTTEYRNITVEFLDPKIISIGIQPDTGSWGYVANGISPPADPHAKFISQINLQAAVAAEAQLLAGDSFPPPDKPATELLIAITDVDLTLQDAHIRKPSGTATWIADGRTAALMNSGSDPANFVVLQLWKPASE